jgi:general stress protein 26
MPKLTDSMCQLSEGLHYATLASHNEDGSIHLTPVWYLFDNGKFYVESLSSDRKARNVVARPTASIVADIGEAGRERWVSASGTVSILRGDQSREANLQITRRYLTEEALRDPKVGPVFLEAADMTICLTPQVWRSWSLQSMDEQYFGGILTSTPQKWFRPVE